uniref:Uncharacterized protein n=1 Tax=Opuntia streptacantha TaxID=393608 RepID=A0A7C9ADZ3_OPUST
MLQPKMHAVSQLTATENRFLQLMTRVRYADCHITQLMKPFRDSPLAYLHCLRYTRALYLPRVAVCPTCRHTKGSSRSTSFVAFARPSWPLPILFKRLAKHFPFRSATCAKPGRTGLPALLRNSAQSPVTYTP